MHKKIKNLHLIISVLIVIPIAIVYGFKPDLVFDFDLKTPDQTNIYKAIMGLYLGFSILWIIGIFKPNYWKVATLSNIFFMFGLGFGRLFSIFFDGFPSSIFVYGTIGEIILGFFSFYLYRHQSSNI